MSSAQADSPFSENPLNTRFPRSPAGPTITKPQLIRELSDVWKTLKPLGVSEEQVGNDGPVILRKADDVGDGGLGDFGHIWKFLKGVKDGSVLLPPTPVMEGKEPRKKRQRPKSAASEESRSVQSSPSSSTASKPSSSSSPLRHASPPSNSSPTTEISCAKENKASKPKSRAKRKSSSKDPSSPNIPSSSKTTSASNSVSTPPSLSRSGKPHRPPLKPSLARLKEKSTTSTESAHAVSLSDGLAKEAFLRAVRTSSNSIKQIKPDLTIVKKCIKAVTIDGGARMKFVTTRSWETRKDGILKQLLEKLPQDRMTLLNPFTDGSRESEGRTDRGIHVFIDNSNIIIGFYRALRRICNLSETAPTARPNFDFNSFSLIIERGRRAETKVLVGSLPSTAAIEEAERLGYTTDLLTRVEKDRRTVNVGPTNYDHRNGKANCNGKVNGSSKSADGKGSTKSPYRSRSRSSSSASDNGRLKRSEQAVDEIISLKMALTLLDHSYSPGILVLASGDASVGEFSDGFGTIVERFLERGWEVEVCCWRQSCNARWRDEKWKSKWGEERFRVCYLEDFVEGLLYDECVT